MVFYQGRLPIVPALSSGAGAVQRVAAVRRPKTRIRRVSLKMRLGPSVSWNGCTIR